MTRVNSPWDLARKETVHRKWIISDEIMALDPGVNYFILGIEKMGGETWHSCEGHENSNYRSFYIYFSGSYELAYTIATLGFFTVGVGRDPNHWRIDINTLHDDYVPAKKYKGFIKMSNLRRRNQILRWASYAWEAHLQGLPSYETIVQQYIDLKS